MTNTTLHLVSSVRARRYLSEWRYPLSYLSRLPLRARLAALALETIHSW